MEHNLWTRNLWTHLWTRPVSVAYIDPLPELC